MSQLSVRYVVSCLLGALFCLLGWFAPSASAQGQPTVIVGGTLIDGAGKDPLPEALIIIEGDKIKTVAQKEKASYPPEARTINAEGKFILPGLIDMHVHYDWWMPELFLAHGVTTAVDLASYDWVFAQKEGIAKGKIPGPRLVVSSFALDGRLFWNVPFFPLGGPEAAREAARSFITQGVSLVKIYTEISPEELEVVVKEAHQAGLPVMGHIASIDAAQAARIGVDGLAHASGVALATIADANRVKELREFESIGISVDYPRYLLYHAFMDPTKAEELIIRKDPLQDIRNTQTIDTVIKDGKVIDPRYHADFRNPIPSPPPPWGYIANPQPTIKSLSPLMGAEGAEITLMIEGENFLATSQVEFNKQKVTAIPVSSSQVPGTAYLPYYTRLQATIPARLVAQAGRFPVTVANPPPEGGPSNVGYFIVRFK